MPKTPAGTPLFSPVASKPGALQYVRPWRMIVIVIPLFILFNYMAFFAVFRTEKEAFWEVTPPYLTRLEQQSMKASQEGLWYDTPLVFLCLFLFYLEKLVSVVAKATSVVYRRKGILFQICAICWSIHFYEIGVALRLCRKCNATWMTTLKYLVVILFVGICQLNPLKAECREYVKRERRRRERQRAATGAAPIK